MADANKQKEAKKVYKSLCDMLDERKLRYQKHEDDLVVTFGIKGEDIPMDILVAIDTERELVRLISPLPVLFAEDNRVTGAVATCQANYVLADGSFDYDVTQGRVSFRMTSSYMDSIISPELFDYMISVACITVDEYNDRFFMLSKGMMSLEEFFKKNNE